MIAETGRFAVLPGWLHELGLSERARLLYAVLGSFATPEGAATIPLAALASVLGCSESSARRAIRELEAVGAVRAEARANRNRVRTANRYVLVRAVPSGSSTLSPVEGYPVTGDTLERPTTGGNVGFLHPVTGDTPYRDTSLEKEIPLVASPSESSLPSGAVAGSLSETRSQGTPSPHSPPSPQPGESDDPPKRRDAVKEARRVEAKAITDGYWNHVRRTTGHPPPETWPAIRGIVEQALAADFAAVEIKRGMIRLDDQQRPLTKQTLWHAMIDSGPVRTKAQAPAAVRSHNDWLRERYGTTA